MATEATESSGEAEMKSFVVKSRILGAVTETAVEAESREHAIAQVIEAVAEGEEVQISTVEEAPAEDTAAPVANEPA